MKKLSILIVGLLVGISANVCAAAADWYVGADVGEARAVTNSLATIIRPSTTTSLAVHGGYRFSENIAVEGGYIDLGTLDGRLFGGYLPIKASAISLLAVGTMQVSGPFDVFGKLGYAETTTRSLLPTMRYGSVTYGFGVSYNLNDSLNLRVGYERFDVNGSVHANNISAGVNVGF